MRPEKDAQKTALLIIDFQNSIFMHPPAHDADGILVRIAQLIDRARSENVPVVYVQHEEAGTSWENGSTTWAFPTAIAPRPQDIVSPKTSCDAFRNTNLQSLLAEQQIRRVVVCGYATEFCIDTNVRRLASLELETVVVRDAHTTRDRPHLSAPAIIEHHNWVWSEFANPNNLIQLVNSDAVQFGPKG